MMLNLILSLEMTTCSSLSIALLKEGESHHVNRQRQVNSHTLPQPSTGQHTSLREGETITPIEIIINGHFSEWKSRSVVGQTDTDTWLGKEAPLSSLPIPSSGESHSHATAGVHVHVEATVKVKDYYALDMINERLPGQLASCYGNMTSEVLEEGVYSPAAYGDRLCG